MTLLDLFSGVGGFSLAASWAGIETIQFVENNTYCQRQLKRLWPKAPIHADIKTYTGQPGSADIISGGVPCQPASTAGQRRGAEDDRWLWPEAFRIVREVNPSWVVFENVRGLLSLEQGLAFENLLLEMEAFGYETQSFVIPACAVGADHIRDRLWIIANAIGNGSKRGFPVSPKKKSWRSHSKTPRYFGLRPGAFASRAVYGISGKLDKGERIKALGNAIVPQVAHEIFEAIIESERIIKK